MKKETTTVIKGVKGFDKDLKCRGKQYELNGEYNEKTAKACESGMHFCENPFDVLQYYPLTNGNRFAEVEGSGKIDTHDEDSKVACTSLKIGAELNLKGLIQAAVKFIFEKTTSSEETKATTGYRANAATTGYRANAATTGDRANAATTGNSANAATTGDSANAATTGYRANAATTGDSANAATTGDRANAATTGNSANAATTGDSANAATTGYRANAATTGDSANAATTGDRANAATTGYRANAATTGKHSVAAALGPQSAAKAAKGSWIVLSEWEQDKEYNWCTKDVKALFVDGKKVKSETFYKLVNGKIVEA